MTHHDMSSCDITCHVLLKKDDNTTTVKTKDKKKIKADVTTEPTAEWA